jgi:hypothetical protein
VPAALSAGVELALRLEGIWKAKGKAAQVRTAENRVLQKSDKQEKPIDTKRELAARAGVSRDTIAVLSVIVLL